MRLSQALRIQGTPRVAFVGAGGKTTAMFRLARELLEYGPKKGNCAPPGFSRVIVTASTHLSRHQLAFADSHTVVLRAQDVDHSQLFSKDGLLLFTGALGGDGRSAGLEMPLLDKVKARGDADKLPILVEADGSRQLPVKAPGENEPPIPSWVDTVVVLAGLSALGRPLSDEYVHRAEVFAQLSGLKMGETISSQALLRVLTHEFGGLKNIPPRARRVLLLNQANTAELQAAARRMAHAALSDYHAVLVSNLAPLESASPAGEEPGVLAVNEPVGAVLLAAGGSSRLGKPKQTLLWRGKPLVRHVAETALAAGLSPLVVVTGYAKEGVEAALKGLPVVLVHNLRWEAGQSTSVGCGIQALPEGTGAALFLLADQPLVPVELIRKLIELHTQTMAPIVAPLVDGRRGNPVLFDRCTFQGLTALQGDQGGRALFSRFSPLWLTWNDAQVMMDVDTPEDYRRLLER